MIRPRIIMPYVPIFRHLPAVHANKKYANGWKHKVIQNQKSKDIVKGLKLPGLAERCLWFHSVFFHIPLLENLKSNLVFPVIFLVI